MENPTRQFLRFAIVGIMNTGLDLLVLNALIVVFGVSQYGFKFVVFKCISFVVAVINSFIFNKVWVFKNKEKGRKMSAQAANFLIVSIVGLAINASISYVFFKVGSQALPGINSQNMANGAALMGTLAVLVSNFFGYKFFVFKNKKKSHVQARDIDVTEQESARQVHASHTAFTARKKMLRAKMIKVVRPRIASF